LQELWSSGYAWDDPLSEDMQSKWIRNIQRSNSLLSIEFQRKPRPELAIGNPEIHGFDDGGEKAYGSVIFLRWKLSDETFLHGGRLLSILLPLRFQLRKLQLSVMRCHFHAKYATRFCASYIFAFLYLIDEVKVEKGRYISHLDHRIPYSQTAFI
jgi:hypothetical protein